MSMCYVAPIRSHRWGVSMYVARPRSGKDSSTLYAASTESKADGA